MPDLMPFDEINRFENTLSDRFETDPETGTRRIKSKQDCEDIIDEMLDLFLLSYANGVAVTNEQLSSNIEPTMDDAMQTVDAIIADMTWRQRVTAYYESGNCTEADIVRIVETESHRDSNTAAHLTATRAGATTKTWQTMMDDRVRDTHDYIESVTVPIDAEFYTYDGDSALYPGGFTLPENNINCRCWLTYK